MSHALAGARGFAPELDPQFRKQLRLPLALVRLRFERELAALEQSRPRRRRTAMRVMAANVRRISGLVDSLVWLDRFTRRYLPPREPTAKKQDRIRRSIERKLDRIVAEHLKARAGSNAILPAAEA